MLLGKNQGDEPTPPGRETRLEPNRRRNTGEGGDLYQMRVMGAALTPVNAPNLSPFLNCGVVCLVGWSVRLVLSVCTRMSLWLGRLHCHEQIVTQLLPCVNLREPAGDAKIKKKKVIKHRSVEERRHSPKRISKSPWVHFILNVSDN